ncbi:MAG: hypothetical protein AAGI15_08885 [Pseudomonadota bacterium]
MITANLRRATLAATLLLTLLCSVPGAYADARSDYLLYCGGCHLEDGSGSPPEVPDLRVNVDRLATTQEGRAYLVQVPGSFQAPISHARLGEVLNWIIDSYHQVPGYQPFTGDEVARLRETLLMDPLKLRRELLQPDAPSESEPSPTPLAQRSPGPH